MKTNNLVSRIKNSIKVGVIVGAGIVYSIMGAPKPAHAGSAEIMGNHEIQTYALKAGGDLGSDLGYFTRHRLTRDADGSISTFTLGDVSHPLGKGIDAVVEGQAAPGMGVVGRAGLQTFVKNGDASLYALATYGHTKDLELVGVIRYAPAVTDNTKLVGQLEMVSNMGPDGHNFSVQRMRVGAERNGYEAGAALDLTEAGGETNYTVGLFLKKSF